MNRVDGDGNKRMDSKVEKGGGETERHINVDIMKKGAKRSVCCVGVGWRQWLRAEGSCDEVGYINIGRNMHWERDKTNSIQSLNLGIYILHAL